MLSLIRFGAEAVRFGGVSSSAARGGEPGFTDECP
jgi:hypothetical protein